MKKRILYIGLDPSHYQTQGEIIHCPLIQIIPRPLTDPILYQSLQNFAQYTHLLLTSKSSVSILYNYLIEMNFSLEAWKNKIVCVVGKVTAFHLSQLNIFPQIIAKEETAEGLVAELTQLSWKNSYVFWPHSSKSRPVLKEFFEKNFIPYQNCVLYEPQIHLPPHIPPLETIDEVVFTSPSTVKAFLSHFSYFPIHLHLTAIGPITAHFLESQRRSCGGGKSQEFLPST